MAHALHDVPPRPHQPPRQMIVRAGHSLRPENRPVRESYRTHITSGVRLGRESSPRSCEPVHARRTTPPQDDSSARTGGSARRGQGRRGTAAAEVQELLACRASLATPRHLSRMNRWAGGGPPPARACVVDRPSPSQTAASAIGRCPRGDRARSSASRHGPSRVLSTKRGCSASRFSTRASCSPEQLRPASKIDC